VRVEVELLVRVEEILGWLKTVGGCRKTRHLGIAANRLAARMLASAFNLLRIGKLTEAT
jgi:hypothetical protein